MINPDQEKRIKSAREALGHPWFQSDSRTINELLILNHLVSKDPSLLLSPMKDETTIA